MEPLGKHLIAQFDSRVMAPHTCGMDDELPPAGITPEEWAADLLAQIAILFALWHAFRIGSIDRATLVASIQPLQATVRAMLERGVRRYDQAEGLSMELLELWTALWTFVTIEGGEPTNNAAEQALHPALLWRRVPSGCLFRRPKRGGQQVCRTHPGRCSDMPATGTPHETAQWTATKPV